MCAFTVGLIDFDDLTEAQRRTLARNLERKRKSLETQLKDINESLKGIDKCLKVVEKKSRSKKKRRA